MLPWRDRDGTVEAASVLDILPRHPVAWASSPLHCCRSRIGQRFNGLYIRPWHPYLSIRIAGAGIILRRQANYQDGLCGQGPAGIENIISTTVFQADAHRLERFPP